MDKLKMQSENLVNEHIEKIAQLFPNCVTEAKDESGKIVKLVDFDLLKQELSNEIVEGNDERYTLNWAGKKQAILTANAPINATLRPCREESVDFDNTKNLYIEGDNLDVLKLLRETYLGKVKMIYIDPPYNTGNDFVYEDNFASSTEEYLQNSRSYDEQGNRMFQNNDSNGRFHSDWLSMMYSRLKLARDLLTEDGVIFISIDDNEIENLRKICDEIFGSNNFAAQITVKCNPGGRDYGAFAVVHDYLLVYTKNKETELNMIEEVDKEFPYFDEIGGFSLMELRNRNIKFNNLNRPNLYYPFYINPSNIDSNGLYEIDVKFHEGWIELFPQESQGIKTVWRWGKEKAVLNLNKEIKGKKKQDGGFQIVQKYRSILKRERTIWDNTNYRNEAGSLELKELFEGKKYFDYPKSIEMITNALKIGSNRDSIIMDFFSGSASTAHAIFKLNAEDSGNRKFILIQLPEQIEDDKYFNLCEVAKERILRAGKMIKEDIESSKIVFQEKDKRDSQSSEFKNAMQIAIDNVKNNRLDSIYLEEKKVPDIGFRVLKLDSSCMKDVYYSPEEINQSLLAGLEDNIKEDRTPEDLLFQVMLDMGVMLSSEIKTLDIKGKKVFNVNDGNLVCCFDKNLTETTVTEIAKMQPLYAVFRDSSMASDTVNVNFDQIFETYSPTTIRKVL